MPTGVDDIVTMALFARVVRARSFTAAAKESGLAKSAVSRRIAQLEEQVGVQLLRRSTRKLALTDEGLRFYEHCSRLLDAALAARESIAAASHVVKGPLRISAPVTFSQMYLADALTAFLHDFPDVRVELVADDHLVDVVVDGFDVVVRIGRLVESSLVMRKLAEDRLVVCGAPSYLARAGEPETPADLVAHNCLHYGLVPLAGEWRFRGAAGPYAVPVRGNFVTTCGTVLKNAALAGLGLAVLPRFMVARDVAEGRLKLVLEGQRRARIGVYAVVAPTRALPKRVKALLTFLSARFSSPPWAS